MHRLRPIKKQKQHTISNPLLLCIGDTLKNSRHNVSTLHICLNYIKEYYTCLASKPSILINLTLRFLIAYTVKFFIRTIYRSFVTITYTGSFIIYKVMGGCLNICFSFLSPITPPPLYPGVQGA